MMNFRQGDDTLFRFLTGEIKGVRHGCQLILRSFLLPPLWGGLGRGYFSGFRTTFLKILQELLFCQTRLVLTVLLVVHSELEQLFVVLSAIPAQFLHLFDVLRQYVRIEFLWIVGVELKAFLLRQLNDLRCQFSR